MSKKLATAVHLTDESGVVHSFLPGATPPKWARKLITNPKAWAEAEPGDDAAEDEQEAPEVPETPETPAGTEIPKKNASTADWRAYADSKGFETDDDIKRDEIIAALAADGIPTE